MFDVWLMLGLGAFGWGLARLGLEATPLVLGFVLGPALEEYVRRTLLLSRGDMGAFVADPVALGCLVLGGAGIALLLVRRASAYRRGQAPDRSDTL